MSGTFGAVHAVEPGEAVAHTGITLAVAMAIARALLHRICAVERERERERQRERETEREGERETERGREREMERESVLKTYRLRSIELLSHFNYLEQNLQNKTELISVGLQFFDT